MSAVKTVTKLFHSNYLFAFLGLVLIAGSLLYVFIIKPQTEKLSFKNGSFSTLVASSNNSIKSEFESGGAKITFTLDDTAIKRINNSSYQVSDNTLLNYEIKKDEKLQGLKETIILKNKKASSEYVFNITLRDVANFGPDPRDKSWRFFNNQNKEVFKIPAGFMIDANGERSEEVAIGISKCQTNNCSKDQYTLKVSADKKWLNESKRAFPIEIDPSVIVSGGIDDTEAQFGGLQRKVVYVNSNWYAFYTDASDIFYKKSADGVIWDASVDIDTSDADNLNPTVWAEGNLIYASWIDNDTDSLEVNTINTASSDALGTKCTSSDQGTIDTTSFTVSNTVVDNGTVYIAYSDTSSDTEAAIYKLVFSGCTFTDITSGSGLTFGDRPVITSIGNNMHMIFQDGDLSTSTYDGSSWVQSNATLGAVTDNNYDVATDGTTVWALTLAGSSAANLYSYNQLIASTVDMDSAAGSNANASVFCPASNNCKIAYFDGGDNDISFADCNDSPCSSPTITDLDTDSDDGKASIYCPTSDNCKIAFYDGTDEDITFVDCNDETCSSPTVTDIDTDGSVSQREDVQIYCPAEDDCKLFYFDATDSDVSFVDCNNATCSAPTITDVDADVGSISSLPSSAIYCISATDCKLAYFDSTDSNITFVDCNNAACSTRAVTDIDAAATSGSNVFGLDCPSSTDCKLVYQDSSDTNGEFYFVDCNDTSCSAPTITTLDTSLNTTLEEATGSLFCPSATNCKVVYHSITQGSVFFLDCNDAACTAPNTTTLDSNMGIVETRTPNIYCSAADDCKVVFYDDTDDDITFIDCVDETCTSSYLTTQPPLDVDSSASTGKPAVYCPTNDDCKIAYSDLGDSTIKFVDCDDAACSASTINTIDAAAAGTSNTSIYCPTANDCKVVFYDDTDDDITFADCNDAACSSPTITDLDTAATDAFDAHANTDIYCPAADNCKVVFFDGADDDITFADCNDAACSSPTITDLDTAAASTSSSGTASIFCIASDDCKVAYFDAVDGDVTYVDCVNEACSGPTITDADTSAGSELAIVSIACPATDDCKIAYYDDAEDDVTFVDCNDTACSAPTVTDIDITSGSSLVYGNADIACPASDDCKVTYYDGVDFDITFVDCDDSACSAKTTLDLDTDVGSVNSTIGPRSSIFCATPGSCKIAFSDFTDGDITFIPCAEGTCASYTTAGAPWYGETNVTGVSLTYTNSKLYAAAILDASEQAYWKWTSTTGSLSWSAATSFDFTPGDLGQLSIFFDTTNDVAKGIIRQGANLESSGDSPPPADPKGTVKGGTTFKGNVKIK